MYKNNFTQKGFIQLIPVIAILGLVLVAAAASLPALKNKYPNLFPATPTPVATPTESPSPSPTITPSPTPVPTSTATAKPTIVPTQAPPVTNAPPSSGYSRISVASDMGTFTVDLGAADIATTRVVVDTASESDCGGNCPAYPLATYISRRGAYAGINGSYFCPIDYSSCAGKENSFDFLVMNFNKTYLNSSNNVYSTNPGVIFGSGYIRFVGTIQEWGRDTSVDGVLSNYPMLVQGGNIAYAGSGDSKITSRGNRSFVANKGNLVYIGVVHGASVEESAHVLKALGMENGLNLDDGGSTAFWYGGYKVGPGRSIPNAILFIAK